MKNKLIVLSGFVLGFAPLVALAQQTGDFSVNCSNTGNTEGTVAYMICQIGKILSLIVPILIVLGVIYFIWGVITYVIASDEEAKKSGRNRMIYGIIGLAVIVSVWGLVRILTRTLGINEGTETITYPTVPI